MVVHILVDVFCGDLNPLHDQGAWFRFDTVNSKLTVDITHKVIDIWAQ